MEQIDFDVAAYIVRETNAAISQMARAPQSRPRPRTELSNEEVIARLTAEAKPPRRNS